MRSHLKCQHVGGGEHIDNRNLPSERQIALFYEGSAYRRLVRIAYRDPIALGDLAVTGSDLQEEAGVPAGPMLGQILHQLLDLVVDEPSANRRDALLAAARRLRAAP